MIQMHAIRKLFAHRGEDNIIHRTGDNWHQYDAALRKELIVEVEPKQAVLTERGQTEMISTLYTETYALWDEVLALTRRIRQIEKASNADKSRQPS